MAARADGWVQTYVWIDRSEIFQILLNCYSLRMYFTYFPLDNQGDLVADSSQITSRNLEDNPILAYRLCTETMITMSHLHGLTLQSSKRKLSYPPSRRSTEIRSVYNQYKLGARFQRDFRFCSALPSRVDKTEILQPARL